jgi:hypothetical protein
VIATGGGQEEFFGFGGSQAVPVSPSRGSRAFHRKYFTFDSHGVSEAALRRI